jgi:RNA-directed DNA polymerase
MAGWRGYFGFCQARQKLTALTRRVRLGCGLPSGANGKASASGTHCARSSGGLCNMAGSGHGPWHLAPSKALSVRPNTHFKSLGLPHLSKRVSVASQTAVYGPYVGWCQSLE